MEISIKEYPYKYLVYVFHVVGAVQFSYSVFYDYFYVMVPKEVFPLMQAFGGKFKFLTFWDAILQSIYFIICVYIDFFVETGSRPFIVKLRDYVHPTLAFPVGMFVGVTFWGLYAVDRELVLPNLLDKYFPTWLNHIMHTNIMFFALLELVLTYRKYPSRTKGLTGLVLFQLTYMAWMHIVYFKSGQWVYNVFNVLNIPQRIAFLSFSVGLGCVFYFIGEKLNSFIWGKRIRVQPKRHKHK